MQFSLIFPAACLFGEFQKKYNKVHFSIIFMQNIDFSLSKALTISSIDSASLFHQQSFCFTTHKHFIEETKSVTKNKHNLEEKRKKFIVQLELLCFRCEFEQFLEPKGFVNSI